MVTDANATPRQWAESLTLDELTTQLRVLVDDPHKLSRVERTAIVTVASEKLKTLCDHARLDTAEAALNKLYSDWYDNGGPSPDVRDESRAIARAVDAPSELIIKAKMFNEIWDIAQTANTREVAAAHLKAIDSAKIP